MQIITASDASRNRAYKIVHTDREVHEDLSKLTDDPGHNIAWTSDVNKYVPFKAINTHVLTSGDKLKVGSWPGARSSGYTAGLAKTDSVTPEPSSLVQEMADSKVKLGNWQVIITSYSLYEKLFGEKKGGKREIAEEVEKFASQVITIAESYFPPKVLPYLKFICTVADTGQKISENLRKADKTKLSI